jgi:hypothetical protein
MRDVPSRAGDRPIRIQARPAQPFHLFIPTMLEELLGQQTAQLPDGVLITDADPDA